MAAPPPLSRSGESALAAFRGLPMRPPRERPLVALDSVLEVLLERHRVGQPRLETLILERWESVLGSPLARRCTPIKVDATGTLFVAVPEAPLRQELQFRKRAILHKLQDIAGPGRLRDVVFRAG